MEIYLLKFSACLFVFWLVYLLFLERQNMHRFKRFYLLGVLTLALVIPALTITEYVEPIVTNVETAPEYFPMELALEEATIEEIPFLNLETTLWLIYGLGVLVFASRFIINLIKMQRRISKNENIKKRSFIYVLLQKNLIPHSFFRYIFFNKARYELHHIPKKVVLHEETHAKQLHSLDIIVLELFQIAFWFHPLVYILKHHVKLNHEFLADQAVLEQGTDTKVYQHILLQFSLNTQDYQFSSAINYSSIKKRFTVMKTQTSKTRVWLSTLLVLPIIAILFYSFAEKEYVEKESNETSEAFQVENTLTNEGATEAMIKEYNDWIIQFTNTHRIDYTTYKRLVAIYDIMTEAQRSSVEPYPEVPNMNLSKVKPKTPTKTQFESWKNESEYAIWLDGNHISNSKLSNYTVEDIIHFTGSKVYNNARSNKFPQPFQFNLYTKNGFKTNYQESAINSYNEISRTYSGAIGKHLKGPQTDNSELKILKAQADKIYNSFTKEEKEKYHILPVPPVPAQKQRKADKNEILNYSEKYKLYESLRSVEPHYIHKSADIQKEMDELFSDLGGLYFRMSKENKAKVKRPISPIKPYVQITLNGQTYYKKRNELTAEEIATLPPPPAKQKTSKGGPDLGSHQLHNTQKNKKHIKPVEVLIKKDNSILLNKKLIKIENLTEGVTNVNKHLTIEERRNYVSVSVIVEKNNSLDFSEKVQKELNKAEILAITINYKENQEKNSLPTKHNSLFSGLSIEEAKLKKEKYLKESQSKDLLNKKMDSLNNLTPNSNPWSVTTEVTYIRDSEEKEDPQPQEQESILPIVNAKTIKKGKLALTRNEIKDIMLSTKNGKVTEFKFKIPGQPTQHIKSNVLDAEALKHLESAKKDDQLVLFALKDGTNSEIAPIVITVTN